MCIAIYCSVWLCDTSIFSIFVFLLCIIGASDVNDRGMYSMSVLLHCLH